jgi:hypothetical protein
MIVHGQPKTTSAYIQSTGRIGRRKGGLIVTFYRSTRPRDMSHYEMFCGYHMNMDRFVEPITVSPFSPGTLERCAGPVAVGILRNLSFTKLRYHEENSASSMATDRQLPEVVAIPSIFEERAQKQPSSRRPPLNFVKNLVDSELDTWQQIALKENKLKYAEYRVVSSPVVLGDPEHKYRGLTVVYPNVPQSLRDIEDTTGFQT